MKKGRICALCLMISGAFVACTTLRAQSEPSQTPTYSYVSVWTLPRAQWGEMAKYETADAAQMDKFLADGTITGYGEFENFIHTPGQPTHGEWFRATSEGNILKVLESFYSQPSPPVLDAAFKHRDYFNENVAYGGRSGNLDGAYETVE
ncbi:MAG: hypothetical protein ACRD11_12820 [Terriglobia bacterium]